MNVLQNRMSLNNSLSTFFFFLCNNAGWNNTARQASVQMLTNAIGPILHVSKHVGNTTLVAQCTPVRLGVHGFAGLCLSLCLPVFVPCRGHFGSSSNKWHSVATLLQVTHPLDFIYQVCWLQGRHTLQIVPMIICTLGTIYLYNQTTEISYGSGILFNPVLWNLFWESLGSWMK